MKKITLIGIIKMTILEAPFFLSIFLQWKNLNALSIWHDMPLFILDFISTEIHEFVR